MFDNNYQTSRRQFLIAGSGALAARTLTSVTLAYEENEEQSIVVIKRDEYGVPHVYATGGSERSAVFFGHGYAVAADRLYQLEMYRRFYHGTISEVLGPEWVAFDREARHNRSTPISLSEQFERYLNGEHRAVLRAFADGINRFIEHVETGDREFHKGFVENDFRPEQWDMQDVAGMFIASMSYFSDYQLETLDAAVLAGLEEKYPSEKAMAILSDLNWGDDPSAPTSMEQPTAGYTPPYTPAGENYVDEVDDDTEDVTDESETTAANILRNPEGDVRLPANPEAVHETEMERRLGTLATGLDSLGLPFKLGSNALAVASTHTESGDPLLFGGPQMGFNTPSVMYEVGLHGSNFDITGNTVAGYPFVMFGHNHHGAMTSTAGLDNSIQTFVETIRTREDKPDQYLFQDEWLDVESHTETIPVRGAEDETVLIRHTRHGIVTQWRPEDEEAIAQTRSYAGRGMKAWKAFYEAQFATDAEEFVAASQQCDYSLNFMWAGDDGDVAYVHLGRYPNWERVPWDLRFPADGSQYELTDDDYLSAEDGEVPYAINPSPGYTAQWNNKPAPDWNNGDMSYAWGTDHRVQRIINLVEYELETTGDVSYEFLKRIVYDIAFVDLRAIRYKDNLLHALSGANLTSHEQAACDALREWENFRQGSGERYMGLYPVGYTVWDVFFPKLLAKTFQPWFGSGSLYEKALVFLNYRYGRPTLMRALHPEEAALEPAVDYFRGQRDAVFREAFAETVADLRETYGDDVSAWRKPARVDDLDNVALFGMPIGVGDAGDIPFLNRGTENHFVRVGAAGPGNSRGFRAENILPPGESGYVAPDGTVGKHYDDQLDAFIEFEYKKLLFSKPQVARKQESIKRLHRKESDPQNGGSEVKGTDDADDIYQGPDDDDDDCDGNNRNDDGAINEDDDRDGGHNERDENEDEGEQ